MPLNLPQDLPAIDLLKKENIFVIDTLRASSQDIRPLKVVVLNLMPLKIATETDLIRLLSNSPLQIELDFLKIKGHVSKNTPAEHMDAFYKTFDVIRNQNYDGMIVTGAPIELMDFEQVSYWNELKEIFDWARIHVTSSLYICWAAQASLNYFYGIKKYPLKKKIFGIFEHELVMKNSPLFRGYDDVFFAPHSRHTEFRKEDILKIAELQILSESKDAGVYAVVSRGGREFYVSGHSEYSPKSLHEEYMRDLQLNLPIEMPCNYYLDNEVEKGIVVKWRSHANLLFSNWLNYFVYQQTPYDAKLISSLEELNS